LIDSKLNPLADIFLPSYIKNKDSVSDITEFKEKCEGFSKKHKQVLCDDLSLNIELIDTNVKEDLSNYEIVELKKSKLNENELAHIIYTHNKVVNSGLPNYHGCKIPVKTRINVEFFRENLLDYKDKVICEYLEFGARIGFHIV
jgi:hypothetical protein